MKYKTHNPQSGQVGIITLLIMAVVLTVAISLSQRTMQEQDIAFIQDESTRVFNAAESGVEQALFGIREIEKGEEIDLDEPLNLDDIEVTTNVTESSVADISINSGRVIQIPLAQVGGDVSVSWWDKSANCDSSNPPAAMIISVLSNTEAIHHGFDPCANNRDNDFEEVMQDLHPTISVTADDVLLRVRPVYNHAKIFIAGSAIGSETVQYNIQSGAYSDPQDIARTLEVRRSALNAPDFMDFTLVSGSDLTKN